MHVNREPWLSIAVEGQMPNWLSKASNDYEVVYFFSKSLFLARLLNKFIEKLRWETSRYAGYGISYTLMALFRPWKKFVPKSTAVNECESGVSNFALKINIPEMASTMRWKKLAFLRYFLDHTESEYAIITTPSSVLNFDAIFRTFSSFDQTDAALYAGPIHAAHDCNFISSCFTIMNRKSAKLLLENLNLMPVHLMDDVAFGVAFKKLKVNLVKMDSLNVHSLLDFANISSTELNRYHHFRVKSQDFKRKEDIKIMLALLKRLTFPVNS